MVSYLIVLGLIVLVCVVAAMTLGEDVIRLITGTRDKATKVPQAGGGKNPGDDPLGNEDNDHLPNFQDPRPNTWDPPGTPPKG